MNAYIASFMLLLFNAVGLTAPAAMAAEEQMAREVGSPERAQAALVIRCVSADSVRCRTGHHHGFQSAALTATAALSEMTKGAALPVRSDAALRSEAGDKLEHQEGAP